MSEISALTKQRSGELPYSPACEDTVRRLLSNQEAGPHQTESVGTMILDFSAPRTVKNANVGC